MTSIFDSIPTIDVAALRSADPAARRTVVDELGRAARDVGFAQLVGHGIDPSLFDALLTATKTFFALPYDEKMRVYIGRSTNHRGYVPAGEEVFAGATPDHKEAYDLSIDLPSDHPEHLAGNPLLGPNQWPALDGFAEPVDAYYRAAFSLGRILLRAFAEALGEDADLFDRHVTTPPSQLRLIHYPHDPSAADRPGIGAHTDYEVFTLLRPTAPGLEVLNGNGEWIDVPYRDDAIVLNIGDLLEIWTNGRFAATSHRVRKVAEERYSFPLFFNVDYHTRVAPLPQFVDADGPRYDAVVAGEHLFAQTAQSFTYLRRRIEKGHVSLPDGARPLYSLGREAQRSAALS
ncbi:isopenicillin N synthase family dioxygenase [Rhodococcus sp. SGAir0479]|uniref:isopenicillin N synthase family dioxygenase n=1 Tax=Rhodococcus sp. SGAir0479 TaxID=2567884 RepID=UPI0010CD6825|nr:2-oxoglutarate and iron-dependent oxygenase domain-containing protein [Rhodococcus sp. SGAir0479]QCQ93320.1 isopenicillin N synthase family oxygenase [Rhodococcus sp. SGAir0479]